MKEMFRDVLEQVMEVEMDDELGRERCQRSEEPDGQARNYRNGYSRKTVKTQLPGRFSYLRFDYDGESRTRKTARKKSRYPAYPNRTVFPRSRKWIHPLPRSLGPNRKLFRKTRRSLSRPVQNRWKISPGAMTPPACWTRGGKGIGAGFSGLSDYEKELAVHDWMIDNGSYDTNQLSNLPRYQENPDNDNPFGFLIGGVGICRGYVSTFQLFMDLLGIECISVEGQSHSSREEHAWNMVRLDGEWYCVDVTWDDPVTDLPVSVKTAHKYFNVTSEFMRSTEHYWDESGVPEAAAVDLAWKYSQRSREEVKRRREKMACSEAEDAGGLAPAKDDNEAARFFIRRTLPILDCVDYKI